MRKTKPHIQSGFVAVEGKSSCAWPVHNRITSGRQCGDDEILRLDENASGATSARDQTIVAKPKDRSPFEQDFSIDRSEMSTVIVNTQALLTCRLGATLAIGSRRSGLWPCIPGIEPRRSGRLPRAGGLSSCAEKIWTAQKNCALADCVNGQGASFDHVSTRGR